MDTKASRNILVTGIVQGVGFRPHVYNLARSMGLNGTVGNTGRGVLIVVEGSPSQVDEFIAALKKKPPFLAHIEEIDVSAGPAQGCTGFSIVGTVGIATGESLVPPDAALCSRCRSEIINPRDRHYRYPFTNCTNCGPRFTIIKGLPYDRHLTSMAGFAMCRACNREYRNAADRRFHAQPTACPECGPKVWLVDAAGMVPAKDWVKLTCRWLREGKIIAIKGLGGFHLACDAQNAGSIRALRVRKGRPAKPLAVMCRDLEVVREHCSLTSDEEAALLAPAAPVVVLGRKKSSPLPDELGPGLGSLGVMLPYTPLHALLLTEGPPVLVMTSGNRSGLPLVIDNQQALMELNGIADYFIMHNRDIVNRCDDSVVQVVLGETQFLRRSRGYVPAPVVVPESGAAARNRAYLGAGGDMKNTFCFLKTGLAYMSQHVGSLDTRQGMRNYNLCLDNFSRLLRVKLEAVGYDPHPNYHVSRLAPGLAPVAVPVWHHHAHMASCMAENGLDETVIGIILDGTGYGRDGSIWGFEVLCGDYLDFTREFHLENTPLPGGERAVSLPWITATAWLTARLGKGGLMLAGEFFPGREVEMEMLGRMMERHINSPPASSCGRMFDAVAALTGICRENTYDGQAAVELGELAPAVFRGLGEVYPFALEKGVIGTGLLLEKLIADIKKGIETAQIALKFHDTVITMVVEAASRVRKAKGANSVVLSGGSWHNRYLLQGAVCVLRDKGFEVYYQRRVPPGDGGIALGQAMVAMKIIEAKKRV